MYIYLYLFRGKPVYVGQASDVKKRHSQHIQNKDSSPFEKFVRRSNRKKFTLKIIDKIRDVPGGRRINRLENDAMDLFGTYFPESGKGWNFGRAGEFGNYTEATRAAWLNAHKAGNERKCRSTEWKIYIKKRSRNPLWRARVKRAAERRSKDPKARANCKAAAERRSENPKWIANNKKQGRKNSRNLMWRTNHSAGIKKRSSNPAWRSAIKSHNKKMAQDPMWQSKLKSAVLKRALRNPRTKKRYKMNLCSRTIQKWKCNRKRMMLSVWCYSCHHFAAARHARWKSRRAAGLV